MNSNDKSPHQILLERLAKIPALQKSNTQDPVLHLRFFHPLNNWQWYICEYDPKTTKIYGYIKHFENDWEEGFLTDLIYNGYVMDGDFKPCKFSEFIAGKPVEEE